MPRVSLVLAGWPRLLPAVRGVCSLETLVALSWRQLATWDGIGVRHGPTASGALQCLATCQPCGDSDQPGVEDFHVLPELSEQDASGDIAQIYAEIRTLCAVPYVSSLQRYLATRPGWLPWAWAAMRPAFVDGSAQTSAWRLAATLTVPALPPLSHQALRVLGVDAPAEHTIRAVCETFIRASPTNLMFSGIVRWLLAGQRLTGSVVSAAVWTPPVALPTLPSLVDWHCLTPDQSAVLLQLGTEVAGQPFVPGLYRMLAHWPAYLAHVATVLGPRFDDPVVHAACQALLQRVDAAVPGICATLPALSETAPMPPREQTDEVLAALARYRETSPQMVLFGTLIRNALPAARASS